MLYNSLECLLVGHKQLNSPLYPFYLNFQHLEEPLCGVKTISIVIPYKNVAE